MDGREQLATWHQERKQRIGRIHAPRPFPSAPKSSQGHKPPQSTTPEPQWNQQEERRTTTEHKKEWFSALGYAPKDNHTH